MPAPPAKAKISAPFPNPSNAVAREGFGEMWETLFGTSGLLGATGLPADARTALGAAASANAALTGAPTAPNAAAGTRGTRIATMQSFADEFTASKAATGWQKLPSGVIIQWGPLVVTASSDAVATFPVAFPGACTSVSLTVVVGSAAGPYFGCVGNINLSAFSAGAFSSGTRIAAGMIWLAVGY